MFRTIIEKLPNAIEGQYKKINSYSEDWEGNENLKNSIMNCNPEVEPIVIISKFLPIKRKGEEIKLYAFGRLLQGTIKQNDILSITNFKNEKSKVKIEKLNFWMGQTPIEI